MAHDDFQSARHSHNEPKRVATKDLGSGGLQPGRPRQHAAAAAARARTSGACQEEEEEEEGGGGEESTRQTDNSDDETRDSRLDSL